MSEFKRRYVVETNATPDEMALVLVVGMGKGAEMREQKFVIGIKESDGKPMTFYKGVDSRDKYLNDDYSLSGALEFETYKLAERKARYLEENYGPMYCYVLSVEYNGEEHV